MTDEHKLELKNWSVLYPPGQYALKDLSVTIPPNITLTITGAHHAGKTTFLRSINRLHELNPAIKTSGEIRWNGQNIRNLPVVEVRKKIGMIVREPNVFPNMSIRENVIAGYTLNHIALSSTEKNRIVEEYLQEVELWNDVKNDLHRQPGFLSLGQQQCLCIARTLALQPEILLMDEPTVSLDPVHASKIESLISRLKNRITLLIATCNLTKIARISDYTLYLEKGELVEYDVTAKLFWEPKDNRTERFITNRI